MRFGVEVERGWGSLNHAEQALCADLGTSAPENTRDIQAQGTEVKYRRKQLSSSFSL